MNSHSHEGGLQTSQGNGNGNGNGNDMGSGMSLVRNTVRELMIIHPAWRLAAGRQRAAQNQWARAYLQQMAKAMIERNVNSQQKVDKGLAEARANGSDYLPNPGKFASWCKLYAAASHRPFERSRALVQRNASPEFAAERIKEIRRMLKHRRGAKMVKKPVEHKNKYEHVHVHGQQKK